MIKVGSLVAIYDKWSGLSESNKSNKLVKLSLKIIELKVKDIDQDIRGTYN